MAEIKNLQKIVTEKVRFCFANVFKAKAPESGGDPKYSLCILVPKSDLVTLERIKGAVEAAKQAGLPSWGGKLPANLKLPLRDGDVEKPDRPEFKGMMFLNANSKNAPLVVDLQRQDIIDQSEVYSGCYGKVSVTFYPFSNSGNKGIGCGLNGIQKVADGESLGGGRETADEMFAEEEDPLA